MEMVFFFPGIGMLIGCSRDGDFLRLPRYLLWIYESTLRDECGLTGAQPYWDVSIQISLRARDLHFLPQLPTLVVLFSLGLILNCPSGRLTHQRVERLSRTLRFSTQFSDSAETVLTERSMMAQVLTHLEHLLQEAALETVPLLASRTPLDMDITLPKPIHIA